MLCFRGPEECGSSSTLDTPTRGRNNSRCIVYICGAKRCGSSSTLDTSTMRQFPDSQNFEGIEVPIEIERKYLLGSEEEANRLIAKIRKIFPEASKVGYSETSYFFPRMNKSKARELLLLVAKYKENVRELLSQVDSVPDDTPFVVRIRRRKTAFDTEIVLSLKAGQDPLHDTSRIEIELNGISESYLEGFEANGVEIESEWRGPRSVYHIGRDTKVDIERVTGYGWKAEVEAGNIDRINEVEQKLGLTPADPKLLDAMYRYYINNWRNYCTIDEDKYFTAADWVKIREDMDK
jgi:hypothetical protein